MLRILRQGQRWVLSFVILTVGGVFVFYLGIGGAFTGGGQGEAVVEVDGRRYGVKDVIRVRRTQEESYRQALGDQFDSASLGDYLNQNSARTLLRFGLLASEAERMGLRATDAEVRGYLRSRGFANTNGRLDRDLVMGTAEREFGSLRLFEARVRDDILSRKAERLLRESVAVSSAEARDSLRYRREELDIAYVALKPELLAAEIAIPAASVAELLATDPDRVRGHYEERLEEFDLPERVRARHVLIRVPRVATDAIKQAARDRAKQTLERIRGGADIADIALELSEDPGTKNKGGDLGFFARGRMAKAFEDVAFSLEPGEISDIVETVHGLHIIRVEEKRPPEKTPFESVREQLAEELLVKEQSIQAARTQAEALRKAVADGQSLTDAARAAGLTLERPEGLRRGPEGLVPGLGQAPEILATAFATGQPGQSIPRVFEVGDARVLIEILDRRGPADEDIEPLVEETRLTLLNERRNQVQQTWLNERQEVLRKQGRLALNLAPLDR